MKGKKGKNPRPGTRRNEKKQELPCPACGKVFAYPRTLASHMKKAHPGYNTGALTGLVKAIEGCKSIPAMLSEAAKWIDNDPSLNDKLAPEVIMQLKREDAKALTYLRVIIAVHMTSTMRMAQKREMIQESIIEGITPERLAKMQEDDKFTLLNRLDRVMESDKAAIKDYHGLTHVDLSDSIDKLLSSLTPMLAGAAAATPMASATYGSNIPYKLPEDPRLREQLRRLFSEVDVTELVDFSEPIEGEYVDVEDGTEAEEGTSAGPEGSDA